MSQSTPEFDQQLNRTTAQHAQGVPPEQGFYASPADQAAFVQAPASQPRGVVVPDHVRQPQDRRSPAQIDAEGGPVAVEYAGQTYTFPGTLDDADGTVLEAIDDQKLSHAVRGLLSAQDWDRFRRTNPRVRDYSGLFEAYAKTIGLESTGESGAS